MYVTAWKRVRQPPFVCNGFVCTCVWVRGGTEGSHHLLEIEPGMFAVGFVQCRPFLETAFYFLVHAPRYLRGELAGKAPGSRDATSDLGKSCMNEAPVLDVLLGEMGGVVPPCLRSLGLLGQRVGHMQRGGREQRVRTALCYGDGGGYVDEGDIAGRILEEDGGGRLHVAAPDGTDALGGVCLLGAICGVAKRRGSLFVGTRAAGRDVVCRGRRGQRGRRLPTCCTCTCTMHPHPQLQPHTTATTTTTTANAPSMPPSR